MKTFICSTEDDDESVVIGGYRAEAAAQEYAEHMNDNSGGELFENPNSAHLDVLVKDTETGEVTKYRVRAEVDLSFYASEIKE